MYAVSRRSLLVSSHCFLRWLRKVSILHPGNSTARQGNWETNLLFFFYTFQQFWSAVVFSFGNLFRPDFLGALWAPRGGGDYACRAESRCLQRACLLRRTLSARTPCCTCHHALSAQVHPGPTASFASHLEKAWVGIRMCKYLRTLRSRAGSSGIIKNAAQPPGRTGTGTWSSSPAPPAASHSSLRSRSARHRGESKVRRWDAKIAGTRGGGEIHRCALDILGSQSTSRFAHDRSDAPKKHVFGAR